MTTVTRCRELGLERLREWFARLGITVVAVDPGQPIPGSFWGEPEAGLITHRLFLREDTPVHSALHEGCHYLCADPARQASMHTDAGGDDAEECAVCYLQVLLADTLPGYHRERLFTDMDRWGYSFRLGSARRWFYEDARDAAQWLQSRGLIDEQERLCIAPVHDDAR